MAKYRVHVPVRIITQIIEVEAEDRQSAVDEATSGNGKGTLIESYAENYKHQGSYYVINVDGKDS